jgi:hypothetical protein
MKGRSLNPPLLAPPSPFGNGGLRFSLRSLSEG